MDNPGSPPAPAAPPARFPNGKTVPRGHPPDLKEQAKCLYASGLPIAQIVATLGLSRNTLAKWVNRGKWTQFRSHTLARFQQAALVVSSHSLATVSKSLRADLAGELQAQMDTLKRTPIRSAKDLPTRNGVQGRTAVVHALADTAATVCGWKEEQKLGLIVPMCAGPEPEPALEVQAPNAEPPPAISTPEPTAPPDLPGA